MRKALFPLLSAVAFGFGIAACSPNLDDVNNRIDDLEVRVTNLEKLNSEIDDLRTLITALQNNVSIVSVTEITDGYEILLSNGDKLTIKNGKDGKDGQNGQNGQDGKNGQDGATPVIGVKAEGGVYYWTVNGEYLLDDQGNKIRVSAGETPKLKIEDNKWYISYDGGTTWEFLAEAGISGGSCLFTSVTVGDDAVTFVLAGGETFQLPLATAFDITLEQKVTILPGASTNIPYVITGATNPEVYCIVDGDITASIDAKTATTGDVVITAPAEGAGGMVIVFVEEGGKTTFKHIKVSIAAPKEAIEFVDPVSDGYEVVFNHTKAIDAEAVSISWKAADGASFVLEIAATEDMADAYQEKLNDKTVASYTNRMMNHIVCGTLNGAYKTTPLYYRVSDETGTYDPSPVKNIKFTTEFDSYTDPRGNEIYPVTKVGGKYWMAENMRATTYSDGTALEGINNYPIVIYNDGYLGKRAGVFYTYAHVVRCHGFADTWFETMPGADAQIQGICPEGWHVASNNDFTDAIQAAATALGTTYSDDFFGENSWPELASAFRFGGDFPKLADNYHYGNELGLYFVPSCFYRESDDRTVAPFDYGYEIMLWSVTAIDTWDSKVFQCNQWNDLIFASHHGNHPVGAWAAQVPARCVKNY